MGAILTIGFISAHSESLAMSVIESKAIPILAQILKEAKDHRVLTAIFWSLSQIAHSSEHSRAIAICEGIFSDMMVYCVNSDKEINKKAQRSFKLILQKCTYFPSMESLLLHDELSNLPETILCCILDQFVKVLPKEAK